jgi:hypothetical protein
LDLRDGWPAVGILEHVITTVLLLDIPRSAVGEHPENMEYFREPETKEFVIES